MLKLSGRIFYFAEKDHLPVGVFSAPEKAPACDTLTQINPFLLDGSPVCEGYVCMAKGNCVMLLRKEDGFESAHFDLGPSWGINLQSATIGLCGPHNSRKNVLTTELYLFEIDRVYAAEELKSLHPESLFSSLTRRTYDCDSLSDEQIRRDYIGIHLDNLRRDALRAEKESSAELQLLIDRLMSAAYIYLKQSGHTLPEGVLIERVHLRMTHRLITEFSMEEMRQLAELLQRDIPAEDIPNLTLSATERDLICRLARHIPTLHLLPDQRRGIHSRNIRDYLY
jgi:hypothetical protein